MSSLQQSHNLDLESGGGAAVSGGESNNSNDKDREESGVSECSVEIVDLGSSRAGHEETKLDLEKSDKDCRICHLSMDDYVSSQDSGILIELGCSCKDDLAAAHKQCAEAWFKIKGNKTCEICGSIAQNVVGVNEAGEPTEHQNDSLATATVAVPLSESRTFWQGHRFLNFLLACMVFAFVVSWLFHFNVPS